MKSAERALGAQRCCGKLVYAADGLAVVVFATLFSRRCAATRHAALCLWEGPMATIGVAAEAPTTLQPHVHVACADGGAGLQKREQRQAAIVPVT